MAIHSWLGRLGKGLLDLLYPPHCVYCGQGGAWLCLMCQDKIRFLPDPGIGLALSDDIFAGGEADPLDAIYAVAAYDEPLRTAIHHYKYQGVRVLAEPLGNLLYSYWQLYVPKVDLIIPVPLHTRRLRQRGYNQATLLAQALATRAHIPLHPSLVSRIRHTSPQVELGPEQRQVNVAGAFACHEDVTDASILLIDDVCTTGATLRACGQALRDAGAERLYGLVLAKAV